MKSVFPLLGIIRQMMISIIILCMFTAKVIVSQDCYAPDGSTITSFSICDSANGASLCCATGDTCLTKGLCQNPFGNLYRGACTDRSYESALCPSICISGKPLRSALSRDLKIIIHRCIEILSEPMHEPGRSGRDCDGRGLLLRQREPVGLLRGRQKWGSHFRWEERGNRTISHIRPKYSQQQGIVEIISAGEFYIYDRFFIVVLVSLLHITFVGHPHHRPYRNSTAFRGRFPLILLFISFFPPPIFLGYQDRHRIWSCRRYNHLHIHDRLLPSPPPEEAPPEPPKQSHVSQI